MKAGLVVTALGGMSVAIGAMSQQGAIGEARMPGLWLMLGGVLGALAGAIIAWLHRPGEAARRLDALGGRIDRAQRARTQQLTLFPISALIFSSLGVLTVGRLQDGEALGLTDWLMMSLAPLTQAELADKVGVSRKTVNTVENGVFVPSTTLALSLARALGVTVEDLFWLND